MKGIKKIFLNKKLIRFRTKALYNYEKYSCPFKRGTKYFYFRNSGLENQSVLYIQDNLKSKEEIYFNPNELSDDGTTALSTYSFSESAKYFAYGLSYKGSDWVTIQVKQSEESKTRFDEKIEWVKFSSIDWTPDEKGFFYSRYPTPKKLNEIDSGTEAEINVNHQIYYHLVGTMQQDDILILSISEHPHWFMNAEVSDDGKFLICSIFESTDPVNLIWYANLEDIIQQSSDYHKDQNKPKPVFVKLFDKFEAEFSYITNEGSLFYFKTNLNSPRYKLIAIDLNNSSPSNWVDIIEESKQDVLTFATVVNKNVLITCHTHDVADVMTLRKLENGQVIQNIELPGLGTVSSITSKKQQNEFFYKFTSFTHPGTIYHFDFKKPQNERLIEFRQTNVNGYDASNFITERVFFTSLDGTRVPMFIVHSKETKFDGNNPTLLYGYGGFSSALQPYFSIFQIVWMQNFGGVYAVANIRGGSEYGEEWHQAGTKEKKQNVFDDFQSAAHYLISNNYTCASKLAIFGGSNGGLLVGACLNQRPDLFGAVVASVGVMDMLNFHKYTIGHAWTSEYGSSDNKQDFEYLIKYSPLHNIDPHKKYPSTLLMTADHDDRVVPFHSYKFIAALQTALGSNPNQNKPLLIRIETKAGHSAGKPTFKIIEEYVDIYVFLTLSLGASWNL